MYFKILSFALVASSLLLTATSVYAGPSVQVVPGSFNFGQVKQGEQAVTQFHLRNTGTDAVSIEWMDFSDPGLVAWTNSRIAAGSAVEVSVSWNTSKLSGDVDGQIALGLSDPENPQVTFTIKGNVTPVNGKVLDE